MAKCFLKSLNKWVDSSCNKYASPNLRFSKSLSKEATHKEEIRQFSSILQKTLSEFKVKASIAEVKCSPRIIRFEVSPQKGTRTSSITELYNEISIAFQTQYIRMEKPKYPSTAVSFEIPRKTAENVCLRDLFETDFYLNASSKLSVCIGKSEDDLPVLLDTCSLPHLLIAGTIGSGKTNCLHAILLSILAEAKPEDVRLILVDPKGIEFSQYNGVPHLLYPVETNPKNVSNIIDKMFHEMERRYQLMVDHIVKNITEYNAQVCNSHVEPLPHIYIIIDEIYDCFLASTDSLKEQILKITQKGRAAGIHLILATQRLDSPSLTEKLIVNFSTRIACNLLSAEQSVKLLGESGAEKLLGNGDMLLQIAGRDRLIRAQGVYVSPEDVKTITDRLKSNK